MTLPSSLPPRLTPEALLAEYDAACSNMGYPRPDDAQEWCTRLAAALRSSLASARSAAFAEAAKECDEEEERARRAASSAGYNDSYNLGEAGAASALASRIRALAGAPAEPEVPRIGDVYRSVGMCDWEVFATGPGARLRCLDNDNEVTCMVADLGGWRLVRRGGVR